MSNETAFLEDYDRLKTFSKLIKENIDQGRCHESHERYGEAIESYKEALLYIGYINTILVQVPKCSDVVQHQWQDACSLMKMVRSHKRDVEERLESLKQTSVEPIMEDSADGKATSYKDIINGLRNAIATIDSFVIFDTLFMADVQLYNIKSNGEVTTFKHEVTMSLIKCTAYFEFSNLNGICFLQCFIPPGEELDTAAAADADVWIYPLVPLITLCYQSDAGAFIFPNLEDEQSAEAFGIILTKLTSVSPTAVEQCDDSISDLQQCFLQLLQIVLSCRVQEASRGKIIIQSLALEFKLEREHLPANIELAESNEKEQTREGGSIIKNLLRLAFFAYLNSDVGLTETSLVPAISCTPTRQFARNIVKCTDIVQVNLKKGAWQINENMEKRMSRSNTTLKATRENIALEDAPTSSNCLQASVQSFKKLTGEAADASGWLSSKVAASTLQGGRYLAPHIKRVSKNLLEKYLNSSSNDVEDSMQGFLILAAGSIEGFSTVSEGLSSFARILTNSLRVNSVKLIEYKFGPEAGALTDDMYTIIDNCFKIRKHLMFVQPTEAAKQAAMDTGIALVEEYKPLLREEPQLVVPAILLYADMSGLEGYNDGN